jgi:hypothetical protein
VPLSCGIAIDHQAEEAKPDLDAQNSVPGACMLITLLVHTVDLIYSLYQCFFAHIGVADSIGRPLDILIIVCTLGQVLYQDGLKLI